MTEIISERISMFASQKNLCAGPVPEKKFPASLETIFKTKPARKNSLVKISLTLFVLYLAAGCASSTKPSVNVDSLKQDEMGKVYGYRILMEREYRQHTMRVVEYENRMGKLRIESKEDLRVAGEASKKNVQKVFGREKLEWLLGLGYYLVDKSPMDSDPLFGDKKRENPKLIAKKEPGEQEKKTDGLPKFDKYGCRVLLEKWHNGQTIQIKEYRNKPGDLRLECKEKLWLSGEASKRSVKSVFGKEKLQWLLDLDYNLAEESLLDSDRLFSTGSEARPTTEETVVAKEEELAEEDDRPVFDIRGCRILLETWHNELTMQVKEYENHAGKLKLECKEKLWFAGKLSKKTAKKLFGKEKLQWLLGHGYELPNESAIDNDPLLK